MVVGDKVELLGIVEEYSLRVFGERYNCKCGGSRFSYHGVVEIGGVSFGGFKCSCCGRGVAVGFGTYEIEQVGLDKVEKHKIGMNEIKLLTK